MRWVFDEAGEAVPSRRRPDRPVTNHRPYSCAAAGDVIQKQQAALDEAAAVSARLSRRLRLVWVVAAAQVAVLAAELIW